MNVHIRIVACITTICISAQWLTSLKWGLIDSQSRSTKMLYSYLLLMKVYLFEFATRFKIIWPRPIFKGSSDPSHFIFGKNVGKRRIRHRTTLNLNESSVDFDSIQKFIISRVVVCRFRLFSTLISKRKWLLLTSTLEK